jgi:hypothetical protein
VLPSAGDIDGSVGKNLTVYGKATMPLAARYAAASACG